MAVCVGALVATSPAGVADLSAPGGFQQLRCRLTTPGNSIIFLKLKEGTARVEGRSPRSLRPVLHHAMRIPQCENRLFLGGTHALVRMAVSCRAGSEPGLWVPGPVVINRPIRAASFGGLKIVLV